uniref:Uncharacterized protein n=1 Tax=Esox lucius TaxID=8010 RepID=A0AAY5KZM8_ESOLU
MSTIRQSLDHFDPEGTELWTSKNGASDAEAASQRRKERYRQELLEQIAEQQRNRKREKDLELGVAATGVTDPEKRANRIRPQGNQERLPPEKPRMAFQSPLLEYSHALGLGSGGISPYSQANSRSSHIPRFPGVVPHPPSTLADVYRTPYEDAYVYYGVRNPLDPGLAYCKNNIPEYTSELILHLSFNRPASSAVTIRSGIGVFPAEQVKPSKESAVRYKEALRQQIHDQQERRRLEREERDRYEARLEADMKNHDPWGRGGGGAPLRDSGGNLISTTTHTPRLPRLLLFLLTEHGERSAELTTCVIPTRGVISELSALRRQLRMEQKRLEGRVVRPQVDVFDLARLRLQAPVRRPSSRTAEPNHPHRMHDSLHFRQRGKGTRLLSECCPKIAPYSLLNTLLCPQRNAEGDPIRSSLLDSESAFIGKPLVIHQCALRIQHYICSQKAACFLHSALVLSRGPLQSGMKLHGFFLPADLSGDEDEPAQMSPSATEPWIRPGTSEKMKRLMPGQTLRKERLASRETVVQDWEGPSTYHG